MELIKVVDRLRRRWSGKYEIDDPRPIAAEAPYTFFLPTAEQLAAIQPHDEVKIIIRSVPPSPDWDAERMWVDIKRAEGDLLVGTLDNFPSDIPQLKPGNELQFSRSAVIDILWSKDRTHVPPEGRTEREFWERCMVDDCVLDGRSAVEYVYRERPELDEPNDKNPDSGWRIRGTDEAIAEDEAMERNPRYVALGVVLNKDDSWLNLLDAPVGSAFIRDMETGKFVPCEFEAQ